MAGEETGSAVIEASASFGSLKAGKADPGKLEGLKKEGKGRGAGAVPVVAPAAKREPAEKTEAAAANAALEGCKGLKGELGVVLLDTWPSAPGVKGENGNGMAVPGLKVFTLAKDAKSAALDMSSEVGTAGVVLMELLDVEIGLEDVTLSVSKSLVGDLFIALRDDTLLLTVEIWGASSSTRGDRALLSLGE